MPSVSSAPWIVPSSPPRPCSAMKQRAKPSFLRSRTSRCLGSKACASTPLERKAFSTPLPLISEISRSAEDPPIRTATLPKFKRPPHDAHFGNEIDPGFLEDHPPHLVNQPLDIRRLRRSLGIDDEVGVLLGDARAAALQAFQAARLDQSRR